MSLNDNTVDIEKPDGIYSVTFVVHDFSEFFLYTTIFFIKDSRPLLITNSALSDFWYWF